MKKCATLYTKKCDKHPQNCIPSRRMQLNEVFISSSHHAAGLICGDYGISTCLLNNLVHILTIVLNTNFRMVAKLCVITVIKKDVHANEIPLKRKALKTITKKI